MSDDGPGTREVAYRLFAAEFDDASLSYSESDEERAPNYVVTPTGARVNRLFVAGVLTEVERVNDETSRGRVVDPSAAFVTYAGQYQPDEAAFLERAEPPTFVALTGKARTFEPEDSDQVFTSVRPESLNEVDANVRDRWVVSAAESTLDRLAVFAAALESELRGAELRTALEAGGAPASVAAGVPKAIDHYDTSPAYVEAVRRLAVDALALIAGDREEVRTPDIDPDEGGEATIGPLPETDVRIAAEAVDDTPMADDTPEVDDGTVADDASTSTPTINGTVSGGTEPDTGETVDTGETAESAPEAGAEAAGTPEPESPTTETANTTSDDPISDLDDPDDDAGELGDELGDFGGGVADPEDAVGGIDGSSDPDGDEVANADVDVDADTDTDIDVAVDADTDEPTGSDAADGMYELDDAEREEIESEFGTDFSTGGEVDEPGEADIDVPDPEELSEGDESAETTVGGDTPEMEDAGVAAGDSGGGLDDGASGDPGGSDASDGSDDDTEGTDDEDVDLEGAAVEAMSELDDGDGADRAAVVDAVASEHGVDADAVEDAIQDALMSGKCYEPSDGVLKPI